MTIDTKIICSRTVKAASHLSEWQEGVGVGWKVGTENHQE